MKAIPIAVVAAVIGAYGLPAMAQTSAPGQTPSTAPTPSVPHAAPNTSTMPKSPDATGSVQQPTSGMTTGSTSGTGSTSASGPVPGANSFTESQARSRLENHGFSGVSNLQKDANGVWQGTATKDGQSKSVSLDYQGNIIVK